MQMYLVVIFALTLLSVLFVFYACGLLSPQGNKTSLKGKDENKQKANEEPPNIKREITIAIKDKHSADCESFKTSAKLSFIYQDNTKNSLHVVTVNRFSRENGLIVIEGYSEKTNKQERFLESQISGCVDIETDRKIGNLTVFLKLRKPGLKWLPPADVSTNGDFNTKRQSYNSTVSVSEPGIDMLISYTSWSADEMVERKVRAFGLGRYQNRYYVIAHSYSDNERRTYKVAKFRSCIRLDTGDKISKIKEFILTYNPTIEDLTDEFEELMAQKNSRSGNY